jgi:hypothetical protein
METQEIKIIWQTLANEKLIDKELAEENIGRIIALESSETVAKFRRKLKIDLITNITASSLIIAISIFASIFLHLKGHNLSIEGTIFLILAFSFYTYRSLETYSKIKFLSLSFSTSSILNSLRNFKSKFERISTKEYFISYFSVVVLTFFANVLINENAAFLNFKFSGLQGYVLLFSIIYLASIPWIGKILFKNRFSAVIGDINKTILELEEIREE